MFILDFFLGGLMDQLIDWIYSQLVGFFGNFFSAMGNMGVELFDMPWVQSIVLFFSYLGWALYGVGLVVAVFEVGIECQTGRANVKDAALNAIKGFLAVGCFTLVPVELYKLSVTLQASLTAGITGYGEGFDVLSTDIITSLQGVDIGSAASSGVFGGIGSITSPKSEPSDWAIRMCQAIVAHSLGFTDRNQWTDLLKKQGETLFNFEWTEGSVSDHVIRWCKETGRDWRYSHLGELQVASGGEWRRIDYECGEHAQTRVFLDPKPLPEQELKALAQEPAIRLRDLLELGLPEHDVYLVHTTADVGWVPAADLTQLSDRGKEQFAELLDAKVSAVRPGPYGTELVLDGVDPQLLVQYDQAIADCAKAESAMKLFM